MSKERLEEMINNITFVARSYEGVEPLIEYAKEQFERVPELEEKSEELSWKFAQLASKEVEIRKQNKRYRATINAMQQILKDAIHSLDVGEKVQGLEYGVQMANEALEESK